MKVPHLNDINKIISVSTLIIKYIRGISLSLWMAMVASAKRMMLASGMRGPFLVSSRHYQTTPGF